MIPNLYDTNKEILIGRATRPCFKFFILLINENTIFDENKNISMVSRNIWSPMSYKVFGKVIEGMSFSHIYLLQTFSG